MADGLSWVPRRAVFVRRALIAAGITFSGLVLIGLIADRIAGLAFDLPLFWPVPVAALLTLGFVFDDVLRWRSAQYDRWQIEDGHLIHEGTDGVARIPLMDIDRVFVRFGNRVIVQLASGQRIVLRYLPYPKETAAQIDAAKPIGTP